jgi:hypothetical protein
MPTTAALFPFEITNLAHAELGITHRLQNRPNRRHTSTALPAFVDGLAIAAPEHLYEPQNIPRGAIYGKSFDASSAPWVHTHCDLICLPDAAPVNVYLRVAGARRL